MTGEIEIDGESKGDNLLRGSYDQDNQGLALMKQTKVLAACYLSFVTCDVLMMTLGDLLLDNMVDY
jgi:hypothetical protein